ARDQAITELALISGTDRAGIETDMAGRTIAGSAAPLPGLGLAGYRALEDRAGRALQGWAVRLAPPADVDAPPIAITEGVVDGTALDLAAWGSGRLGQALLVQGGTLAQRRAIAEGIVARGGLAEAGDGGGRLRLEWIELEEESDTADAS